MANTNGIIILFCILAFVISFMAFKQGGLQREGFGPRWVRKQKNKMFRMMRRTIKPYNDDFFDQINRFRRKWL
jgi:hypothetical protein